MKSRLPIALTLIALVGGAAVAAQNSNAQQPPAGAPPSPAGAERHGPPHWAFSPADRAAFLDARIAALHAGLELTPDQEKLWRPVEAALRAGAKSAQDRREKFHAEPHSDDLIALLRRISEGAAARGETLKAIADAAAPLYATLTEDQKHRLHFLLHKGHALFGGQPGMLEHGVTEHGMTGHGMMEHGMMRGGPGEAHHEGAAPHDAGPHDEDPDDED